MATQVDDSPTEFGPDGAPESGPDEPGGLSRTEVFQLLGNDRRRYTLHHLMRRKSAEIGELAEQIAAWENEVDVAEVDSAQRRCVYVALHQTHLPRLDHAGALNYESTRDEIELTETGEDLRVYMDVVRGNDIPWSEFYLGLSGFAAALVTVAWLDIFPFSIGSDAAYAAFVVVLFAVTSIVHLVRSRRNRLGAGDAPPTAR
ncbi:DUF7344 domain-containing protein [Halobaculum gomorrense]|uniref:DUF7344 domain-containing protein n=1 Tax=Halobaculum gomorrense TaxID=43928 RepID=A0A1M5UFK3_9EURY|nr:hypothetical protein [Halobaculum gomorrense]SHH61737.1 hypothetical protein SAMN05443636_3018 [Halobaculum gomorrense]